MLLRTLDRLWKDHLYTMDSLRDGIRFRGYAQRDPKVEYAREGFDLFAEMNDRMDAQTIEEIFKVQIQEQALAEAARSAEVAAQAQAARGAAAPRASVLEARPAAVGGAAAAVAAGGGARGAARPGRTGKVGRNDPCPCGSGKKYKKCCG